MLLQPADYFYEIELGELLEGCLNSDLPKYRPIARSVFAAVVLTRPIE